MRRLALLALIALAGCGSPQPAAKKAPAKKVLEPAEKREKSQSRKRIEESSLPEDAKKELKEAQDLLESP